MTQIYGAPAEDVRIGDDVGGSTPKRREKRSLPSAQSRVQDHRRRNAGSCRAGDSRKRQAADGVAVVREPVRRER